MGYDVVGEIDQVGDGVDDFAVGDRVADMTVIGSNAAYRLLRSPRSRPGAARRRSRRSRDTDPQLDDRLSNAASAQRMLSAASASLIHGAAGAVGAGPNRPWPASWAGDVGGSARPACGVDPRAGRDAGRLRPGGFHPGPARWVRRGVRRHRRRMATAAPLQRLGQVGCSSPSGFPLACRPGKGWSAFCPASPECIYGACSPAVSVRDSIRST